MLHSWNQRRSQKNELRMERRESDAPISWKVDERKAMIDEND
jgi:transposase-like protein